MRKTILVAIAMFLSITGICLAEESGLLLADFEGTIAGGADGTVDFGAGNGSSVMVTAAADIMHSGKQSLKVDYNAVSGGYMYIAKGFGLDAKNAGWMVKMEDINWKDYSAISFYVYGSDSKTKVAVDLKDNGNEMWRTTFEDNFKGWKEIVCPFNEFFARNDWQPDNSDKNVTLDFPVKSFQFEPLAQAKGVLYFDDVKLIKK